VFGLLPLPATVLIVAATVLLLGLTVYIIGGAVAGSVDNLPRSALVVLTYALAWAVRLLPFAVSARLFTRVYLRSRVNRWWFITAAAQVLLVAGSTVSLINYSDEPGQSQYSLSGRAVSNPPFCHVAHSPDSVPPADRRPVKRAVPFLSGLQKSRASVPGTVARCKNHLALSPEMAGIAARLGTRNENQGAEKGEQ